MIDRQDIDALLIGALYGELTPAEEARLAAHLESHPTDRSALDGLRSTREAVRESRILAVQVEPPQQISALLLQEAARRAPAKVKAREENEGWFARFVRSFAAHPAMAAAAMLVMVVGVGGLLYMKNGTSTFTQMESDKAATPAITATTTAPAAGSAATAAAPDQNAADQIALAKRDEGYRVDLADGFGSAAREDRSKAKDEKAATTGGIEVRTPEPTVKELPGDEGGAPPRKAAATAKPSPKIAKKPADDTVAMEQPKADSKPGGFASPPPPPVTNAISGAGATTPPAEESQKGQAVAPQAAQRQDATLVAWAKDTHAKVVAFVKAGNCQDAARLASSIATRAPDYYNQNVATDRGVKQCISYINTEREKEAERANKARAQKNLDASESTH